MHHYINMSLIMFISGILSSMSIWADKLSDVRISLNDIYMALLMTAWMIFIMAILDRHYNIALFGMFSIIIVLFLIRFQIFITPKQYTLGMIPHHSMAVLMSKRLLERPIEPNLYTLATNIIQSQENEINILKNINLHL